MKLDNKDMQILGILDWNARTPITRIAKQTRLNKDVVRYRIKNLEANGIITGYYAVINTSKLGFLSIRLYFSLIDANKSIENKIIDYLNRNMGQVFTIDGEYSLGIVAWEKSIYELDKKLRKFRELYGEFVDKEVLSIFKEFDIYPRKTLSNSLKEIISLQSARTIELKENDVKILKELSKNSRVSSTDLNIKIKIPQTTIIHRIKELEKQGIILGYRANLDIRKLGYENYFLEIYTHKGKETVEIKNYAMNHKNCVYSDMVFPGADIEIEAEFHNKLELLDFIQELKERFKTIKKIRYCSTLEYKKISYMPEI